MPKKPAESNWWEGGQKIKSTQEFAPRRLDTQLDRLTRKQAGRRSADGSSARARVVGTDPETDLAVLRIDMADLPAIVFGNADDARVYRRC